MFLRSKEQDLRKDASAIKEQIANKSTCKAPNCDKPITQHRGPGDRHLCREHQLQQVEYGELGKLERPWTFSRTGVVIGADIVQKMIRGLIILHSLLMMKHTNIV